MTDQFATLVARSRAWFADAHQAGWLDDADMTRLAAIEQGTPADLFVDAQARPLVVAFFGGTGVGKSSLLNRLAGQPIARTGVERPTSREITVYVHESVELADLPAELPIEPVRIKRHSSPAHRNVLWVDAPDIDSTAETNRLAALAWLPHVDLVCYVVSPERYRDDVGWRIVQQRGHKHGWIFVINHWDEGDPQQAEDFARMLGEAGFEDPVLLRTCCVSGRTLPSADQFDQLQAALAELLQAHGVRELTRLGHRARLDELRGALTAAEQRLGNDALWAELEAELHSRWQATVETIRTGAEWSMRSMAGQFAARESGVLSWVQRRLLGGHEHKPQSSADRVSEPPSTGDGSAGSDAPAGRVIGGWGFAEQLWDDWAESKLRAALDGTELAANRRGLAAAPLRRRLDTAASSAAETVAQSLRDTLRSTLARPGTALGRMARRVTGFSMAFLPAVAIACVAWAVVHGYAAAAFGTKPYLGGDFAVHSLLLVLLAWALPFALDRLLRPSMEQTVLRALRAGLATGLDDVMQAMNSGLRECLAQSVALRERARSALAELDGFTTAPGESAAPVLERLVART